MDDRSGFSRLDAGVTDQGLAIPTKRRGEPVQFRRRGEDQSGNQLLAIGPLSCPLNEVNEAIEVACCCPMPALAGVLSTVPGRGVYASWASQSYALLEQESEPAGARAIDNATHNLILMGGLSGDAEFVERLMSRRATQMGRRVDDAVSPELEDFVAWLRNTYRSAQGIKTCCPFHPGPSCSWSPCWSGGAAWSNSG